MGSLSVVRPDKGPIALELSSFRGIATPSLGTKFALNNEAAAIAHRYSKLCGKWFHRQLFIFSNILFWHLFYNQIPKTYFSTKPALRWHDFSFKKMYP